MVVSSLRQDFDAAVHATIVTDGDQPPSESEASAKATGAVVHLPTIGEVHPALPGVGADVLDQGVLGRYPGSADPGEIGNFAVAGHRTTYGRPLWALGELTKGDPVVVETADAYHVYVVRRLRVVEPEADEVLAPAPGQPGVAATKPWMVLTTCHPRFSAQQRLVGFAVPDRSVPRSEGPPPELHAAQDTGLSPRDLQGVRSLDANHAPGVGLRRHSARNCASRPGAMRQPSPLGARPLPGPVQARAKLCYGMSSAGCAARPSA